MTTEGRVEHQEQSAKLSESVEYKAGWNACAERVIAMLQGLRAAIDAGADPLRVLEALTRLDEKP